MTLDSVYEMFAKFGFESCPLSESDIIYCYLRGLSEDDIYAVGCDVAAGFTFKKAFNANKSE